ncbi:MAG: SpoIIE family protein phosphatase [Anaerolineae bacterium]|nr:SpoIIE family protein phosphatase [Anaerolineae bacterium]
MEPVNYGTGELVSPDVPLVTYGVAMQNFPGEAESGDQYIVADFPNGMLVSVIDGLGHGDKASLAAKRAVAVLQKNPHRPVDWLLQECHRALRGTRGVVMSIASFHAFDNKMTWLGIGNVYGMLLKADVPFGSKPNTLLLRGGVVGYNLPTLRPLSVTVNRGDTLIFVTDGIRSSFSKDLSIDVPPQSMADEILSQHRRGTDDALVLVARYQGKPSSK